MSLASHAGKSTFAINGKTVNKRSGTDDIYDITAGSNSFMSGLNMATHDYRLYGNNDLNNRTTLTIPNFTSTSKVLIIHDNHAGNVNGDIYEIMRQTLLGPGDSATIQLGSASPAVTFTLSESGVLDGSWPLGSGSNGTYRTISVCHFYTVVESGSLEERIAELEATIATLQAKVDTVPDITLYHNYNQGSAGYRMEIRNAPYTTSQGNAGLAGMNIQGDAVPNGTNHWY